MILFVATMEKGKRAIQALLILLIFLGPLLGGGENATAQTPDREKTIVVSETEYEWWMIRWETNNILCRIKVNHEGLPTSEDVYNSCGNFLYRIWLNTPPCPPAAKGAVDTSTCEGAYLYLASKPRHIKCHNQLKI